MLLKYRLEMILIVLIGMLMHVNNLVLTCLFLGLTFIQLAMNIVIYRSLLGNTRRLDTIANEQNELKNKKKSFKENFIKFEFWFVMVGIVTAAILTKSIFIIPISLFIVCLELGKLYIVKKLQKQSLQ